MITIRGEVRVEAFEMRHYFLYTVVVNNVQLLRI